MENAHRSVNSHAGTMVAPRGGGWSLEVALETISARANRERADFRERGFRAAGVFVFSFLFSPLARRISSARACDGGALAGRDSLKAREKLSNNQRSLAKQIECLARG